MKKGICLLLAVICSFAISSCGLIKKIVGPEKIEAPVLESVGTYILWNEVSEATCYDIYKNGEFYKSTLETQHNIGNLNDDASFYVIAVSTDSERNSDKSNSCLIKRNNGFSASETMSIYLTNGTNFSVPANILFVDVYGTAVDSSIIIENRYQNLKIRLNNVNLSSPKGADCISIKGGALNISAMKFETLIEVVGYNILKGSDYTTKPFSPEDNTEIKGENGGNGGSGLVLPDIKISGSGNLVIHAGNGGPGGDGSNSSGWENKIPGKGGNGGNGGDAICCNNLYLVMEMTGSVNCYAGIGGIKGSHGINGSALTGAWVMHKLDSMNGNDGRNGLSVRGSKKIICGIIIEE